MHDINNVKVKIGCRYQPTWFERRGNNGDYAAFNPPISYHEERLQRALLPSPVGGSSWLLTRMLYGTTLIAAVVAAGVLV